jgi:hypothetical protein
MTLRILRRKSRATLCAIVGLFALASAQSETVICDNCDQPTMRTEAIALGIGTHYVVDVVNNVVRKFDVSGRCLRDRETGLEECMGTSAIERAVEQSVLAYVTEAHLLSKEVISIPTNGSDNLGSAYNALTTTAGRGRVEQIVNNSLQGRQMTCSNCPPGLTPVPAPVTARFSDFSSVVLVFNPETGKLEVVLRSALDASDNPVIFGPDDFALDDDTPQIFDFSNPFTAPPQQHQVDYSNFLGAARRWGVPIVGAPGQRLRLSCVKVGNGSWECRYI